MHGEMMYKLNPNSQGPNKKICMSALNERDCVKIGEYLRFKLASLKPKIGILCGSGLSKIAESICNDERKVVLKYDEIVGFPCSSVPGHIGQMVAGVMGDKEVLCLQGRVHYYEGEEMWKIVTPIEILKFVGIEVLIITNAAGALNQSYSIGDFMLLKDHIFLPGLAGNSPLRGINDEFGPRFVDMSRCYDSDLRSKFLRVAKNGEFGAALHEGVYAMIGGPSFETPAEAKFLHLIGADAVGMSTAPEAITAKHLGLRVFAVSLITDIAWEDEKQPHSHQNPTANPEGKAEKERVHRKHEKVLKASEEHNLRLRNTISAFIRESSF